MDLETRLVEVSAAELRVEENAGGGRTLHGYASVFNSPSKDLGGFTEIIKPGAFRNTLKSGVDLRALVDHDSSRLLGRISSGTLRAAEDDRGLRVEIDLPNTSYGNDVRELVSRGDVRGMSFAFRKKPPGERWYREGGKIIREITDLRAVEVTVTATPAYEATEIALRVDPDAIVSASRFAEMEISKAWRAYRRSLIDE